MLLNREEIEEQYKWDLSDMYESLEDWEEDIEKSRLLIGKITQKKGSLKDSSENLLELFKTRDEASKLVSNIYVYSHLKLDEDTRDSTSQALKDKAFGLIVEYENAASFIVPEILSIDEDLIRAFLKENEDLRLYEHYLEEVYREKSHTLTSREESIMAQVSEIASSPENIYGMLTNADLRFPTIVGEDGQEIEITSGNFIPLLESSNRRVRKEAFEAYYGVYETFKNTFAASLSGEIKANTFNSKVRNYKSNMEASLDKNNISTKVYDNLLETVEEYFPAMYRYMEIRKRALGLEELHMYDIYTPMVSDVEAKFTYETSQEMIIEALKPLGEKYLDILEEGFNSRWIDVYENPGKRSGAYSSGSYGSKPYVLLNYKDTLDSVFTTAHEMGHSIHSYLSNKNQPYIYSNYSIFVAEVASTVNEVLLIKHLLGLVDDKKERVYLLNHFLEGFRTTLFRQTMFAEFEKLINETVEDGGALTADFLSEKYRELNKKYYGSGLVIDREIDMEWSRIPHFYYNFYVYQYATGYSAAVAIAEKILEGEEGIVEKYLNFLSSGSSNYPIELLKNLGIDMETKEPVRRALDNFSELVIEMDSLI